MTVDAAEIPEATEIGRCARCGDAFVKRRADHRFCGPTCRKLGEWREGDPPLPDPDAIARLFDESRDPDEPVRDDDWRPWEYQFEGWQDWAELDGVNTVARMRELYLVPDLPDPLRRSHAGGLGGWRGLNVQGPDER